MHICIIKIIWNNNCLPHSGARYGYLKCSAINQRNLNSLIAYLSLLYIFGFHTLYVLLFVQRMCVDFHAVFSFVFAYIAGNSIRLARAAITPTNAMSSCFVLMWMSVWLCVYVANDAALMEERAHNDRRRLTRNDVVWIRLVCAKHRMCGMCVLWGVAPFLFD